MQIDLCLGDCLELMQDVKDKSIDMILCDLPYGITQLEWDKVIPFKPLWEQYKRIAKPNAAIVLFSQMPFGAELIMSNRKMFRYEIVWYKTSPGDFLNCRRKPLKIHENILVFYGALPTYNPQMTPAKYYRRRGGVESEWSIYHHIKHPVISEYSSRHPTDVITFSNHNGALWGKTDKVIKHGTSKPVDLLEYLIRTYTNPGDLVLDNCMGSGSTAVACVNTNRDFIDMEIMPDFYSIAQDRVEKAKQALTERLPMEIN